MPENLLEHLNKEQLAAVTHDQGPLMIIAGAGTGKTTVITHRIGWLMEQGKAKPDEILALTFTEKAAAEMEERIDRLVPYGYVDLWVSTFHAFCERILKQHALDIGLPNDFRLLNEVDAWLLVRNNFDRFDLRYYRPAGNPTKFIRALLQHFSRAKDEHVSPEQYLAFAEGVEADTDAVQEGERGRLLELANAYHVYQRLLLENNALDFGDLISYTLKLFQERPQILEKYRAQFNYILVDEFQDTNWAQYELVKMLAATKNNITVVGDDDQSIYKFRGAALSNILQFEEDFPDTRKVVLTQNFRSAQAILDGAYGFIQLNNPNRLEVQLNKEGSSSLSKKLVAARDQTGVIERMHEASVDEEAFAVSQKIVALHANGVPLSEMAILVRANDTAEPFVAALERANVPFHFMALRGLYTKSIILDALAYLRVIDHPYHSPSLYRVLSHPTLGIKPDDLVKLTHACYKKGKALVQIMADPMAQRDLDPDSTETCAHILNLFSSLRIKAARKPVSELFVDVLKESGLLGSVKAFPEREQQELFQYLQQFYDRLKRFELVSVDRSLHAFLQVFEHEQDAGEEGSLKADPEAGPEQVKVMTIHAAKGLEFAHVFIVSLVDRRFPTSEKKEAIPLPDALLKERLPEGDVHLEEERRLMYVALTRAKDAVYLTSAEDYGGVRKKKPSRFIMELGFEDIPTSSRVKLSDLAEDRPVAPRFTTPLTSRTSDAFSFTQLAAFSTCPLQYKFAHLLHVPVFGRYQMSFGKTMHGTLQRFLELYKERHSKSQLALFTTPDEERNKETPVSLDELMQMYQDAWIDEWYEHDAQREAYREKGKQSLRAFYAEVMAHEAHPLYLEKGFTVKVGDVVLRGRIDRIDEREDGVEIIDYKTGEPKTEESISKDDKRQLYIYQLAAEVSFRPALKPVRLTFHYLENNTRVSFPPATPEELQALKEEMTTIVDEIRHSNFAPTPGMMCRYCDFRDICEFRAS